MPDHASHLHDSPSLSISLSLSVKLNVSPTHPLARSFAAAPRRDIYTRTINDPNSLEADLALDLEGRTLDLEGLDKP